MEFSSACLQGLTICTREFPCDMTRVIPKQGLQQEHHIWRCYCKLILVYLAHTSGLLGLDNDIDLLYKFPLAMRLLSGEANGMSLKVN
jgi:hypothetical protein